MARLNLVHFLQLCLCLCPLNTDAASESVRQLEKWPKYAAAQRKALGEVPTACLTAPFVEAASDSNRASCTALAQAWVAYLTASRGGMEEQASNEHASQQASQQCC